jgi:hypothetical protein
MKRMQRYWIDAFSTKLSGYFYHLINVSTHDAETKSLNEQLARAFLIRSFRDLWDGDRKIRSGGRAEIIVFKCISQMRLQ